MRETDKPVGGRHTTAKETEELRRIVAFLHEEEGYNFNAIGRTAGWKTGNGPTRIYRGESDYSHLNQLVALRAHIVEEYGVNILASLQDADPENVVIKPDGARSNGQRDPLTVSDPVEVAVAHIEMAIGALNRARGQDVPGFLRAALKNWTDERIDELNAVHVQLRAALNTEED